MTRACRECGKELNPGEDLFCSYCNHRLREESVRDTLSNGRYRVDKPMDMEPEKPTQAVDRWPHKYFELTKSMGREIVIPFEKVLAIIKRNDGLDINICTTVDDDWNCDVSKIPGQLDAYLEWVDGVNK